ncbi:MULTISPECIES: hypothetical protein [unclassified Pseudomonas]|uniref:hypothetical protein n=1 Tax=unclassified Pseudomonas TaxID=196821 RepID=UPI0015A357E8|nr:MULTISPECIES: hypothetical protein [unclassified Pseudomonas]NWC93801.1 hypothetical protein [Pseudomonas sp. IPO3779]NWD16225.1 hypothetical protein [Pseudomonas sp. IPO3778]
MRALPLITLVTALLLGGCSIPYQTPQARAQIEQDLGVSGSDIIDISYTNFCKLKYGDEAICHAEQGLAVLTRKGLILSKYQSGRHVPAYSLKTAEVLCGHTATSREAAEALNMFTADSNFVLLPLDADKHWNGAMHREMVDYLLANGQPLLIGAGAKAVRPSGKKKYAGGMIPGTKIPYFTEFEYSELVNPCPGAVSDVAQGH